MNNITVITVLRSGPKWLPEYVYNFKKGLDKNLSLPFKFICLSDITLEVETKPLLPIGDGFWSKIQMFRPDLNLTGPCLYFDLDTIIAGNIDDIIKKFYNYNFLMLRDPWKPPQSSSGMLWWQGDYSYLWNEYLNNTSEFWNKKYNSHPRFGDQGFIIDQVPSHFQMQSVIDEPNSISRVTKKESSKDVKIICFAGPHRKPWLSLTHPDVVKHWI